MYNKYYVKHFIPNHVTRLRRDINTIRMMYGAPFMLFKLQIHIIQIK